MAHRHKDELAAAERYEHGLRLWRAGDFAQAAAQLSPLRSRGDATGRLARYYAALSHRAVALEALRQGEYDTAQQHLAKAIELVGPSADLADYLCVAFARTGQTQQCLDWAQKGLDVTPGSAHRWCRVAQAQWQAGNHAAAHLTLCQALRRLGDQSVLHRQLGIFHAAVGHLDMAKTSLGKAIALDQADPKAHYYLALTLEAQGQMQGALVSLQRVCELRTGDLAAAHQLAMVARALSAAGQQVVLRPIEPRHQRPRSSQAAHLARYVTQEGPFVDAFLALPASAADDDLFGLLEKVLRMALAEHDNYADLHHRLSRVLERLGRMDEAVTHARRAVGINPKYRQARLRLGTLLADTDRCGEAMEHLRAVLDLGGDWPDVHTLIGRMHGAAGQLDQARRHLERALQLNHHYRPAAAALQRLAA